jgi:hypothetical protein
MEYAKQCMNMRMGNARYSQIRSTSGTHSDPICTLGVGDR